MKAFPSTEPIYGNDIVGIKESAGMDLRDYFAATALQAIIQAFHGEDTESACATAYEFADEMMKARKK